MLTISKRIDQLPPSPPTSLQDVIPVVPCGTTIACKVPLWQIKRVMFFNSPQTFKQVYAASQILTLNTAPIQLLPLSGTNNAYAIMPGTGFIKTQFNTTPYNFGSGGLNIVQSIGALSPAGVISQAQINNTSSTANQWSAISPDTQDNMVNQALYLYAPGGNATSGDSFITIGFDYRIIDLS